MKKMRTLLHLLSLIISSVAFAPRLTPRATVCLQATTTQSLPQAFSTGYSTNPSLPSALTEATRSALQSHPPTSPDLAIIHASSLYEEPSKIISIVLDILKSEGRTVKHIVGNTAGGVIGSKFDTTLQQAGGVSPIECESLPAVSVTLASLPDVTISTHFWEEAPEFDSIHDDVSTWKEQMGLHSADDDSIFMIVPSPAFQNELSDLLSGLHVAFPRGRTFGGIASTVSSLSRARIFAHSVEKGSPAIYGSGCVGLVLSGDVTVDCMIAQGAKPVGGVYRVVAAGNAGNKNGNNKPGSLEEEGNRSTISAIVLDEVATAALEEEDEDGLEEEEEEEDDNMKSLDEKELKRAKLAQDYAKARIPKPPLAEANFLMRRLSDDDQAFMRRALLIGLERGNLINTPNELARLAKGEGHRFTVRQVASAGMKDGSVTFPLGSVDVEVGARCRFFVRDGDFAKKEVEALWTGYKKKELERTLLGGEEVNPPTGCFVYPTLDRGSKLFGKAGFESGVVTEYLPGVTSVSGFFANGVLGQLDGTLAGNNPGPNENMLHGSSSQYVIFRSKSKRPIYSPAPASVEAAIASAAQAEKEAADALMAAEDEKRVQMSKTFSSSESQAAPRSENGELIVRRREIHSGRTMSVSTVEWSVAEKMAKPTSALEGFMWEKETQVDRLRERISLALLLSQCKASMADPKSPKPRDWIGPVKEAGADGKFVIIPECKRIDPSSGSLRKRYDIPKIVKQIVAAGAPAFSINSDAILFGGSMEDITTARQASNSAAVAESLDREDGVVAPPLLASDLLLYPYQLYKLRMAGADAVNLVVGALENKDLLYLSKIASTINLQVLAVCSSEPQINMVTNLPPGSISALVISNRELETFEFDLTGQQALSLLKSDALTSFRQKHEDIPILVEGRVGIIELDGSSAGYIKALKEAGAFGAIVGGGVAAINDDEVAESMTNWMTV